MDIIFTIAGTIIDQFQKPTLAFLIGGMFLAAIGSKFEIPDPVYKFVVALLLLKVGLDAGISVRSSDPADLLLPAILAVALGIGIELLGQVIPQAQRQLDELARGLIVGFETADLVRPRAPQPFGPLGARRPPLGLAPGAQHRAGVGVEREGDDPPAAIRRPREGPGALHERRVPPVHAVEVPDGDHGSRHGNTVGEPRLPRLGWGSGIYDATGRWHPAWALPGPRPPTAIRSARSPAYAALLVTLEAVEADRHTRRPRHPVRLGRPRAADHGDRR